MKRLGILTLCIALTAGCAVLSRSPQVAINPTSVNELLEQPFGHDESPESFEATLPKRTRTQKLIHRVGEDSQTADTIYYLKYKKSKIATYVTQHGQSFVIGGHVVNPQISLANGVHVGMDRDQFRSAFTDLPIQANDTLKIVHPETERAFSFYFNRKDKLYRYTFSGEKPTADAPPDVQ